MHRMIHLDCDLFLHGITLRGGPETEAVQVSHHPIEFEYKNRNGMYLALSISLHDKYQSYFIIFTNMIEKPESNGKPNVFMRFMSAKRVHKEIKIERSAE